MVEWLSINCSATNASLGKGNNTGHWIVKGMTRDVGVKWIRSLATLEPKLNEKGLPTFVLVSSGLQQRMEIQTLDIPFIENQAKKFTQPKGRGKHSEDVCRIYVKTVDGKEVLVGKATHNLDREYKHVGGWDDEEEGSGYSNMTGRGGKDWQMQSPPNPNTRYYGDSVNNGGKGTGGWVTW